MAERQLTGLRWIRAVVLVFPTALEGRWAGMEPLHSASRDTRSEKHQEESHCAAASEERQHG